MTTLTGTQMFLILVTLALIAMPIILVKMLRSFGSKTSKKMKTSALDERDWEVALKAAIAIVFLWGLLGIILAMFWQSSGDPDAAELALMAPYWKSSKYVLGILFLVWVAPQMLTQRTYKIPVVSMFITIGYVLGTAGAIIYYFSRAFGLG